MGPQINVIGSFFPSWMLCALIGIASAAFAPASTPWWRVGWVEDPDDSFRLGASAIATVHGTFQAPR